MVLVAVGQHDVTKLRSSVEVRQDAEHLALDATRAGVDDRELRPETNDVGVDECVKRNWPQRARLDSSGRCNIR